MIWGMQAFGISGPKILPLVETHFHRHGMFKHFYCSFAFFSNRIALRCQLSAAFISVLFFYRFVLLNYFT